jgi:uncharacterized protein with HEPN domain
MKQTDTLYLKHIQDAISKINLYLTGIDEAAFQQNLVRVLHTICPAPQIVSFRSL